MTMLPRLEAQRQLDTIKAMSVAFGGASRHERQRYMSGLERKARGVVRAEPASPAMLAAMGVMVVMAPAPAGGTANG